ncbi:MAG: ATP-binding protein [Holdemania filiformis]
MKTSEALILIVIVAGLALFCAQGLLAYALVSRTGRNGAWHSQDTLRETMRTKEQTLKRRFAARQGCLLKQQQIMTILTNILPLAMMDPAGRLILYNEGFSRFLSEEGEDEFTYRDERIAGEVQLFLKEAYLSENAIVRNLCYNNVDFQCLSVPIQENGRFTGCLLVFQDITQAMEKERMQKRFIADASHELKTPIAAIKGMIEILNRDDFDDPKTMQDFHIQIEKETKRLEMIVADLLKLSRLSMSTLALELSPCELSGLFDSLIKEAAPQAKSQGVIVEAEDQTHETFWLDEQKIHQALANLLNNALAHSQPEHIRMQARRQDHWLVLTVSDDGCGIDAKHLDRIFERFYRVDKSRSRASGGSGLGLAIVKAIVSAHQGEIEVDSEVGCGSQFVIRLPVRSDAADHPLPAEHSPHLPEPSPQNTNAGASS